MRDGWREVPLGELCTLTKGTTATQKARPGPYPLVVTAEKRASTDKYQFAGEAVCVPLVSSTGHGHASLKRVHYQSGKFAVANIIVACTAKKDAPLEMRYLWLLLDHWRDQLIVPLMKGTANVSLSQAALAALQLPLPPLADQRRIADISEALDSARSAATAAGEAAHLFYRSIIALMQPDEAIARPLSELVSQARAGGTPSRHRQDNFVGRIPWVKSGEVANRSIVETEEHISLTAVAESSAWIVQPGAVVVAMYGATAGQIGQLGVPAATNQAVLSLVADPTQLDSRFLYHLLRSDSDRLKSLATGAAQPNLSKTVIVRQQYRVPPLEVQVEMADRADAALDVVELHACIGSRLSDLRSNLLDALLSGEHEIPESYDTLLAG